MLFLVRYANEIVVLFQKSSKRIYKRTVVRYKLSEPVEKS